MKTKALHFANQISILSDEADAITLKAGEHAHLNGKQVSALIHHLDSLKLKADVARTPCTFCGTQPQLTASVVKPSAVLTPVVELPSVVVELPKPETFDQAKANMDAAIIAVREASGECIRLADPPLPPEPTPAPKERRGRPASAGPAITAKPNRCLGYLGHACGKPCGKDRCQSCAIKQRFALKKAGSLAEQAHAAQVNLVAPELPEPPTVAEEKPITVIPGILDDPGYHARFTTKNGTVVAGYAAREAALSQGEESYLRIGRFDIRIELATGELEVVSTISAKREGWKGWIRAQRHGDKWTTESLLKGLN